MLPPNYNNRPVPLHDAPKPRYRRAMRVVLVLIVIVIVVVGWRAVLGGDKTDTKSAVTTPAQPAFPTIATTGLSTAQKAVLTVARQEYAKQPKHNDATVMKYTEGFTESWCADFISWTFNQAGVPYVHPDTGYWRIPGVLTLKSYYQGYGVYHDIGDGYVPKLGDVAFYFGTTPDGSSTEHVAMILAVQGDRIVTLGGNEGDGVLRVRQDKLAAGVKGLTAIGASGL